MDFHDTHLTNIWLFLKQNALIPHINCSDFKSVLARQTSERVAHKP